MSTYGRSLVDCLFLDRFAISKTAILVFFCIVIISGVPCPDRADADAKRTPPSVSDIRFDPSRPETGDKIKLFLKLHNAVRAELRWAVNDEEVELSDYDGVSDHVVFEKPLKSGDTLTVSITPFNDLGEKGKAVEKSLKCINSPPILKLAKQNLKGQTYMAKIEIEDPEEKPVELTVEGPEGMTIDQKGNIKWKMKRDTQGKFPVKVTGKDEEGARAVLTYTVRIRRSR